MASVTDKLCIFLIQCICPTIYDLFKTVKNCSINYTSLYPCSPAHTQSYKYPFIFTFLVIRPIRDMLKVI